MAKSAAPLSRQERTLATRRRMLRAAYELICEAGYEATTMAAIAERAGVAVQTLFFTFHAKPVLLGEVLHASVVGFDLWTPQLNSAVHQDHRSTVREKMPWFRPFEEEQDPRKAIALYVEGTAPILTRIGPFLSNLGSQRATELEATLRESERLREEASTMIVSALRAKGRGLRPSLSLAQAVDIFFVLTRPEPYFTLTAQRGWSEAKARRWLTELLASQLLAEP
jgi:AcrR family transcriptional regulator